MVLKKNLMKHIKFKTKKEYIFVLTRKKILKMHRPGIEPGSLAWKASILTTIPTMRIGIGRTRTCEGEAQ